MVSRNAGRTWQERDEPGPLLDLVAHPAQANTLVASTESALFRSGDGGASWQLFAESAGLLAWPSAKRLYLVDGGGRVFQSGGGPDLRPRGEVGGQPAAFMAVSERELYVALHDGTVKRSFDRGATWHVRSTP